VSVPTSPRAEEEQRRAEALGQQLERLDGIVLEVYGCTFREFTSKTFCYGYKTGFGRGLRKGRTLGRRAAKGLKGKPNKRGRRPEIEPWLSTLLTFHVDREHEAGKLVEQAAQEFLEIIRRGLVTVNRLKAAETAVAEAALPNLPKAIRAYYRNRNKKPSDRKRKRSQKDF
jgi:hypothetical protein